MPTLNLGILAHVDAGKTSLTERLLHTAGVIDRIGSVDDGDTQTDTLALERQRGITIKSAVVSFVVDGVTVNLIDTPGHSDFIAEVDRVLDVLDGAVLVVSAVEGVQAQTRLLMRALQRPGLPTLVFVNKIDRMGARDDEVLRELADRLGLAPLAMGAVRGLGAIAATVRRYHAEPEFRRRLLDLLAGQDDALLSAYVHDDASVTTRRLVAELAAHCRRGHVQPVFFGSAATGAGTADLLGAVARLLPAGEGDAEAPLSGTVFKVERSSAGAKLAYARLFAGTVRVRDRVPLAVGREGKVTGIEVFERGRALRASAATAGRIARLRGLDDVRIGDPIGRPRPGTGRAHHFSAPTLESVVDATRPADRSALYVALTQLAEQDPLIGLRQDERGGELAVTLYGEVQKEVIEATLAADYGLSVVFGPSRTICIERPVRTGAAVEFMGPGTPFLATVGLRIDPAAAGSGVGFRLAVELGSMPGAFFGAVEETVAATRQQGTFGWEMTDCLVTMTHAGYSAPHSTGADFRHLTPLVFTAALRRAGTRVCGPVHRFGLDVPADRLGPALTMLAQVGAVADATEPRSAGFHVTGEVPAAALHRLQQLLPGVTQGAGELTTHLDHYRPVRTRPPARPRTGVDPADRKQYLLHVVRRV